MKEIAILLQVEITFCNTTAELVTAPFSFVNKRIFHKYRISKTAIAHDLMFIS